MHTHTGYRTDTGHSHSGSRLHGHRLASPGRTHALTGGSARFTALCGETVDAGPQCDDYGTPIRPNVRECGDPAALAVTCRRCLKLLS